MSSVYVSEPSPSGCVLFETTHGPLKINIWCRECPTTTKLFLQLCIDGFYDGMIFHRIVGDFLIQTGALRQDEKPSGMTKIYQETVDLESAMGRRKYETHSRLRFNHRGQVAVALGVNDEDDNILQPQFFITLDEAPYLDGNHVVFGSCTGETIYNALRIGKMAVDDDHKPLDIKHAPRITRVKILENPIHLSLKETPEIPWHIRETQKKQKKKKRKGKKDLNVLSFGGEMDVIENSSAGIGSSHDLVSSKALSKSVDVTVEKVVFGNNSGSRAKEKEEIKTRKELSTKNIGEPERASAIDTKSSINTESFLINHQNTAKSKEKSQTAPTLTHTQPKMSIVEARLAKFKQNRSQNKRKREEDTMAKLMVFQSKVRKNATKNKSDIQTACDRDNSLAARMIRKTNLTDMTMDGTESSTQSYHGQIMEETVNNEQKGNWIRTKFNCKKHVDSSVRLQDDDKGGDGRYMDDYEVIDDRKGRRKTKKSSHHHRRHHAKHSKKS